MPRCVMKQLGACGGLEKEGPIPDIIELINDPGMDVQLATIQTLGNIAGAEAKECLNNNSGAVCQAADQALQELKARENPISFQI